MVLKTTRARIIAIFAAIAVVLAGVLVPIAATAAVAYPAQAPGTIGINQVATSMIGVGDLAGFPAGTTVSSTTQWYRGVTALSGKTSTNYTLVSADMGRLMKVRVIVSVPGLRRRSGSRRRAISRSRVRARSPSPARPSRVRCSPVSTGWNSPTRPGSATPSRSYRWLVNGVATGPFGSLGPFNVQTAHVGKKVVLQALVENFGIAPQAIVSAPVTIVLPPIAPMFEALVNKTINPDPAHTFSLSVSFTASAPDATGPKYQWYRQVYPSGAITAIAGKTASTYTPTAADYNYRIFVRATWTKPGFRPLVIESFHKDYSLRVDFREVSPSLQVGGTAGAGYYVNYEDAAVTSDARIGTPPFTTKSFKWLRSGVVIPGAVGESYGIVSADLGKKMAFLVSASNTLGYLPAVNLPSNSSLPVTAGALWLVGVAEPTFSVSPTMKVTVTPGAGDIFPAGGTVTKYQWYARRSDPRCDHQRDPVDGGGCGQRAERHPHLQQARLRQCGLRRLGRPLLRAAVDGSARNRGAADRADGGRASLVGARSYTNARPAPRLLRR